MAGSARRSEVSQRLAIRRPGGCRDQPVVEQLLRWAQRVAGERSTLELRGLLPTGADHRELRAVRRERRLAAVIRLAGERLGDGKRTALIVDLRGNGGGGFYGKPDEKDPPPTGRKTSHGPARVGVLRGSSGRLRFGPPEARGPAPPNPLLTLHSAVRA